MVEVRDRLGELIRSCVQCGLCLPHCATYLASGSEVQSPRGRLVLLDDLLSGAGQPPDSYLAAFDQCIGCRACTTVCPSGVPFDLIEHGQHLAAGRRGPQPDPAVPETILRRLDSVGFLRMVGGLGRLARSAAAATLGHNWRRRLASAPAGVARMSRLLGSLPSSPEADHDLVRTLDALVVRASGGAAPALSPAPRTGGPRPGAEDLLFFRGCANAGLLSATSRRLLAVLAAAGHRVEEPTGQECCGALAVHTGRPGRAARFRQRNRDEFRATDAHDARPIVVEAAGCSLELRGYGEEFASRVVDATTLLARTSSPAPRPLPLKVAFHDPCHARHGLGVAAEPRLLLSRIPELTWCEATAREVCCGSGGAWGLRYPQMSAELARRKAADLAATGADLVVTTNPGCLGQIADGLALEAPELPILPLTDLWWYVTGQPQKKAAARGSGHDRDRTDSAAI